MNTTPLNLLHPAQEASSVSPATTPATSQTPAPTKLSALPGESIPHTNESNSIPVLLQEIVVDLAIQARVAMSQTVVREYEQRMKAGDEFPPLTVFTIEGKHILVDGAHRLEAAKRCGCQQIACIVQPGTRADAIKFALGANRGHGLQRTNADKRKCAEIALREFPGLSDGAIAELCGVSDRFVAKLRLRPGGNGSDLTRTGRDGKKYRVRQRAPRTARKDALPEFKMPRDLTKCEQALSTYLNKLGDQMIAFIAKHPGLARPVVMTAYRMVGRVQGEANKLSPTPTNTEPAPPVAPITPEH